MDKIWRETFKIWSKIEEYQKRIEESKKIIAEAFQRYKRPYVAYSGGKDSIVMLHLVLQQNQDIDIWHWDHGRALMPRKIERKLIKNAYAIGAKNLLIKSAKALDKEEARWNYKFWYKSFFGILNRVSKDRDWDGLFIGIRHEESLKRKRQYKKTFINQSCYPLLNLTWKDVWAYIISNNLPYPAMYDIYAEILGYDKVRLVTFFDNEFEKLGSPYIDGVLMPEFRNFK
jgi:phosphoadenosine phosphosulfate reductase